MERSKDWMDEAQENLEHARSDLERGFCNWACFSSPAGRGKAVKAVFQKMGANIVSPAGCGGRTRRGRSRITLGSKLVPARP